MKDKELLNKLIEILYNKSWNFSMCYDLKDINQNDLQELLRTPSKNKYLVKWWNSTNAWYLTVKLTSTWIRYRENWFKFDKELEENKSHYISAWTHIQAWWDIIIWNNNKNIINEIDKLLEVIEKSHIDNKEGIKALLIEFQKTQDKTKLVDVFSILWSWASINSMIIALSTLIK